MASSGVPGSSVPDVGVTVKSEGTGVIVSEKETGVRPVVVRLIVWLLMVANGVGGNETAGGNVRRPAAG